MLPTSDPVASALLETLISPNVGDDNGENANVVDVIAGAGRSIARALDRLGNADAATPMGGLEAHGQAVLTAADRVYAGLSEIAVALEGLAEAVISASAPSRE